MPIRRAGGNDLLPGPAPGQGAATLPGRQLMPPKLVAGLGAGGGVNGGC
eukprot:g20543.t1